MQLYPHQEGLPATCPPLSPAYPIPVQFQSLGGKDILIWKGPASPSAGPHMAPCPKVVGRSWGPAASSPAQPPPLGSLV